MSRYTLAIDQGTHPRPAPSCSTTNITSRGIAQRSSRKHYPASGWVEHEPDDLWETSVATMRQVMTETGVGPGDVAAIGITNQRETALVWDRRTGEPIHRAIVWQEPAHRRDLREAEGGGPRRPRSPPRPGSCSTPISPASKKSAGCSTR